MKPIFLILLLSTLAFNSCGSYTNGDLSTFSASDNRRIVSYHRKGADKYYLKFEVNGSNGTAKVTTNEIAYAGRYAMRFIMNETINWPLILGQEIPAIWDVGSTTGNCRFHVTFTVTSVGAINDLDPYAFAGNWEIPAYVSASCASQGLRSIPREYL